MAPALPSVETRHRAGEWEAPPREGVSAPGTLGLRLCCQEVKSGGQIVMESFIAWCSNPFSNWPVWRAFTAPALGQPTCVAFAGAQDVRGRPANRRRAERFAGPRVGSAA